MRRAHRLLVILLSLAVLGPVTAAAASDPTTWRSDAKAPDAGPPLSCGAGAGAVTPAVGAAETELGGIGSASDDHDISYVRVALSTAGPDGCAAAGGTHAQIEVIPSIDLSPSHPALCAVGGADAQPCAVTTRKGEFGGVVVEDDRSGTPAPWAVGAPGAPLYVELPYDTANATFGQEPEHRCPPAGPCSPKAAGYRAQLVVRYLPGTGGAPSAPILTTVGLHDDPSIDEAGTGPATEDDDSDSFIYGPFPSQISRASLRRGWTVHAYAEKGHTGKVTVTVGKHLIASGSAKARRTGKLSIKVKLTRIGPKYLAKRDAYLTIGVSGSMLQSAPVVLHGSSKARAAAVPRATAVRRLAAAQARWKRLKIKSYSYKVLVSCSGCMVPPATVTVLGGKATTRPSTGYGDYKTVARVFALIHHDLADEPYSFHATYNKSTGVPIDVSIHQDKLGIDDYSGFGIREFKRLS